MNQNNVKGITLIALVVTIVILLILAAISINVIIGEDGIINQTKLTKVKQNHAEVSDQIQVIAADYYGKRVMEQEEGLIDYLKNKEIIDDNKVINVEKLLSMELSTGNGTNKKDTYVLEKVENEDEAIEEIYDIIYYDENGRPEKIGNLKDM